MKDFERTLKALANRRRLAILKYLKSEPEASVADIASAIRLSFRATSRHLGVLANAGILEREQRSLFVYYRISGSLPPPAHVMIKLV